MQCYDCSEIFITSDITERNCCCRRICPACLKDYPDCPDCPNVPRIKVNLAQLKREIIRINCVAAEQFEFYSKHGRIGPNREWLPLVKAAFNSDTKAIELHLDLLKDLQQRLTSYHDETKTVLIPQGNFIRSKDYPSDGSDLVDSQGLLIAHDFEQQSFFEHNKIPHSWGYSVRNGHINSIVPLRGNYCKRLRLFDICGDLSRIAKMPLEALRLTFSSATDLSFLKGRCSQTLVDLNLHYGKFTDFTALAGLKALRRLDLSSTKIVDLAVLAGLALNELSLNQTRVADITSLRGMPLTILDLNGTKVSDIIALAGMALSQLSLNFTAVTDITVLRGMPLVELNLMFAAVKDLSAVAGIPGLKIKTDFNPWKVEIL